MHGSVVGADTDAPRGGGRAEKKENNDSIIRCSREL